jgi:hypothetical protein
VLVSVNAFLALLSVVAMKFDDQLDRRRFFESLCQPVTHLRNAA